MKPDEQQPRGQQPHKQGMASPRSNPDIIEEEIEESIPESDASTHSPAKDPESTEPRPVLPTQSPPSDSSKKVHKRRIER